MEKTTKDPADHIASLPDDVRPDMERLDALISEKMAGRSKTLWEGRFWGGSDQSIIGYGELTYLLTPRGKGAEWFIVGLAAQKAYISVLHVNVADADGYVAERYKERLGKVKVGKSSISFKATDDVDLEVLAELIRTAERKAGTAA